MGERSSSVDGNWECLTEAVSPAVNTRRSELWRSSESTCPSPNTSTPAQRGQPASARPYTVPHGSREVGAAPRRHCARLRASRSPPLSATPSTRDAGPPIISDVRPVMPWCRTTSAQDDRAMVARACVVTVEGALWPAAAGGRGTAGSDEQSLGSSAGLWPAEANQLRSGSHIVRSGRCDFVTQRPY